MAERYRTQPLIPMVDETPSERLQRPDQRGDLLDYYLGPTGIPDRIRSANELFNPLAGVADAMGYSRAAANPDNPPSERLRAAGNAAFETGIAALPVGVAKIAGRYARAVPGGGQADDAQAAVETLTGANPDLQDPSRRRFLATAAAAGAAPLLPAEEFLAAGTRAATRTQSLGPLLSKLKQHNAQERALSESLRPLDREIAAAGRRDLPELLMTPEKAQAIELADEAMVQRREIISTLAENTEGRKGVVEDLTDLLTENADALDELDPEAAPQVFENLIERVSQRQGMAGVLDAQIDVMDALEEGPKALEELGLTQPEADLAVRLGSTISELNK